MTNERSDSVPRYGGVLFACGTVLGVCLGFAAGHVFVWSRVDSADRNDGWASSWEPHVGQDVPSLSGTGLPMSEDPAPLAGSPEVPRPFHADSARRLYPSPPADAQEPRHSVRVTAELSASDREPHGLANPSQAAPIDEETRYREEVTRSIIAQEMPQASAQEQDVWFDVLRGLDAADVKGILRMRKHVGGEEGRIVVGTPALGPEPGPLPGNRPQRLERPADHRAWERTVNCLRRVRAVRLQNLCNAETAGYQRLVPVLMDMGQSAGAFGVRLMGVEHRITPGEFHPTGRPLDMAIEGHGFLQVRRNDEVRLTRNGRLTIDDERHLALATMSQTWRLEPPIIVPEDAGSLTIDADGRVTVHGVESDEETELGTIRLMTVLDPAGMRYLGEGLFEVTPGSGPPHRLSEGGALRQYGVERLSQTAVREEIVALEREERLINELQPPAGTASVSDNWP